MAQENVIHQVEMFDDTGFNNEKYSVKSDILAVALLGDGIKPTYKRCFEGLLTKIKGIDVEAFILEDKPLRVRLSPQEYNLMFPLNAKGVADVFENSAIYYSKNTTLAVPQEDDPTKLEYINVVDSAKVVSSGELEVLFTRSILPHLSDVKRRLLIIDITQFGLLTSKYSQKLYETFSSWMSKADMHRASIDFLRKVLNVPDGYSDYKFRTQLLNGALSEINRKTKMQVSYESEKGSRGKAIKYLTFVLGVKDDVSSQVDLLFTDDAEDVLVNGFSADGILDPMFFNIVNRRKSLGKPVDQAAIDAYIGKLVGISKKPESLPLQEIVGMILAQGWKGWPQQSHFIDTNASVKTTPVPGQNTDKPQKKSRGEAPVKSTGDEEYPVPEGVLSPKDLYSKINKHQKK